MLPIIVTSLSISDSPMSIIFLICDLSICFLGKNLSKSATVERLLFFKLEYLFSPNPFNESSFISFK